LKKYNQGEFKRMSKGKKEINIDPADYDYMD
jgi:hypothetical protein